MLHDPTSNQTARSAETCLTVDSNGARLIFYNFKKLLHNINIRCSSIRKDKIIMFNTLFGKACRVISFIIESDDCFNAHLLENRYVICRVNTRFPYLSTVASYGELNATNFSGTIQFKSPFYTRS